MIILPPKIKYTGNQAIAKGITPKAVSFWRFLVNQNNPIGFFFQKLPLPDGSVINVTIDRNHPSLVRSVIEIVSEGVIGGEEEIITSYFTWYYRDELNNTDLGDDGYPNVDAIGTNKDGFKKVYSNQEWLFGGLDWTDGKTMITWGKYRWDYLGLTTSFSPYRYQSFDATHANTAIYKDKVEWISYSNLLVGGLTGVLYGACLKGNVLLIFSYNGYALDYAFMDKNGVNLGYGVLIGSLASNVTAMRQIVAVNASCTKAATVLALDDSTERVLDITIDFDNYTCSQTNTAQYFSKTGGFDLHKTGGLTITQVQVGLGWNIGSEHETVNYDYQDPAPVVFAVDFIGDTLEKLEVINFSQGGGEKTGSYTYPDPGSGFTAAETVNFDLSYGKKYKSTSGSIDFGVQFSEQFTGALTQTGPYLGDVQSMTGYYLGRWISNITILNMDLRYGYIVYLAEEDTKTHNYTYPGTWELSFELKKKAYINDEEIPSIPSTPSYTSTGALTYPTTWSTNQYQPAIYFAGAAGGWAEAWGDFSGGSTLHYNAFFERSRFFNQVPLPPDGGTLNSVYDQYVSVLNFKQFVEDVPRPPTWVGRENVVFNTNITRARNLSNLSDANIKVDRHKNAVITAHTRSNTSNPATFNNWEIRAFGGNSSLATSNIVPEDLLGVI
jgi:hypothetical protein